MAVENPPVLTDPPTPPDPNDRTTFDSRAYPLGNWFATLVTEMRLALANVYNNALSAFNSASAAGNSAANSASFASQAQAWATQTSSEVVAGQGFGAKKYAQDAASSAQQAAASVAALPAGTINDGAPSPAAAFSSQKVATDYLPKSGGTLSGPVTGRILGIQGADVASAAAINLTAAAGGTVDVTGSVSISSIALPAGAECEVRFTGAPLLVNGASLVLKGGANIQAAAGDYAVFRGYAGGVVRLVDFSRASGLPVASAQNGPGDHSVVLNTGNGYGSTNTMIRRFTTTVSSSGTAITYADSATAGASFTINSTGFYEVSYCDRSNGSFVFGISVNSNQLTTQIDSITAVNRVAMSNTGSGQFSLTRVLYLSAGDVVRPHTNANGTVDQSNANFFTVRKVGNA